MGRGLVALGIFGILLSVLIDILPNAKIGIQSTQILGIEVSVVILFAGTWLLFSGTDDKIEIREQIKKLTCWLVNLPVIAWVLTGFFVCYMLFFIQPVFLNGIHRMDYLVKYLPDRFPIGNDLITILDLVQGWFLEGKSPYTIGFYPPFTYTFFAPFLLVSNYPVLFMVFTLFSIVAYILLTLILPTKIAGVKNLPTILLFFLTGLVSYGFQFELERGQYNIFTFLLCLLSIYVFHNHRKHRILAYFLFSLSIQLKLYPAIFIVMFVDDWMDWKTVARRFTGIGLFNFLALFVMGVKIFTDFIRSVTIQITTPTWNGIVNHSIKSFMETLAKGKLGEIPSIPLAFTQHFSNLISTTLFGVFLVIFIITIILSHLRGKAGIDNYLLLTCMIGALIIPVSMDYTLSILAVPMALFLTDLPEIKSGRHKLINIFLILSIALAYSSLLIPFKYKPLLLGNSFPFLFIILVFSAILNFLHYRDSR
jgi:hypothetical protein